MSKTIQVRNVPEHVHGTLKSRAAREGMEGLTSPAPGASDIPDSFSRDGALLPYTAVQGDQSSLWILSLPERGKSNHRRTAARRQPKNSCSRDSFRSGLTHW